MPYEQYWIGKGVDLDQLWSDFDEGDGYIEKVEGTRLHVLRLTFSTHPKHLPLFDHEVIFKTVKGAFHDIKAECMSARAYDRAAPIFLSSVDRGSAMYQFLAELTPLFPFIAALAAASMWYRTASRKDQDFDEKCWRFIRSEFPAATDEDYAAYLKASTTWGRRRVLQRLIRQGLYRVEVSKQPVSTEVSVEEPKMVLIVDESDGSQEFKVS